MSRVHPGRLGNATGAGDIRGTEMPPSGNSCLNSLREETVLAPHTDLRAVTVPLSTQS